MTEDNKLKLFTEDIKIIQEIIKRMAENSFKIKGWTIGLIVIAIVFRAKIDSVFVAFVPLLAFSYLDAYYLMFERRFRKLYNTKIYNFQKGQISDIFQINIDKEYSLQDIFNTYKSKSISIFYGGIFVLILIFEYIN